MNKEELVAFIVEILKVCHSDSAKINLESMLKRFATANYNEGYYAGREDGFNDGYEEGYTTGWAAGITGDC